MAGINSNNGIPDIISLAITGVPGADGGHGDSGDTGITGDAGGVNSPINFLFFAAAHVAAKKMLRSDRCYFYNALTGPEDWNVG